MEPESQEVELFEKYLNRTNKILSITGMYIKEGDTNRTMVQRLRHRRFFSISLFGLCLSVAGEFGWLIEAILTHKTMTEITFFMPCLFLSFLGVIKSYHFIKNAHFTNEIVSNLRRLQILSSVVRRYRDEVEEEMLNNGLRIYNLFTHLLLLTNISGLTLFIVSPLISMGLYYSISGKLLYLLPFLIWYPVDKTKFINWVLIYIHQISSGIGTVFMVLGADNFFATCSAFINIQFQCLQYDIERIDIGTKRRNDRRINEKFRSQLIKIIERHTILIRCIDILESIYTKTTLYNVATSSIVICVTLFNITAINNTVIMMSFFAFLLMALLQIIVFCYNGDKIMENSVKISDAVYNSRWYEANSTVMKDLLFFSIRSQRACKITAYGFTDINLNTFCRILGRAWSYFALLKTVYGGEK